jgi:hypothetical protein
MQVYRANQRIDPGTINWASYSTKNFPLLLRQDPGPGNSLGRIKFMFTNPYDIYLHDTPTKKLFQRFPRAFSHGCIRVQAPVDLAVYLMQDTPMGSEEAIKSAISKGKTRSLTIPSPIPINIVYVTSWVDSEGIVQFRPNIYNRKLSDAGQIVAKNNTAVKTTDTAKTVQKTEAVELADTQPPTEAAIKTTTPAKISSAAGASGQSKALIRTTEALQATAAAKAPAAAPPVAQAKPVAQAPVAAKPPVQPTAPVKAPAVTPPVAQATALVKTSLVSPVPGQKVKVIGNKDSKRYHLPGMKYYNAVEVYHRVEFDSEADAIKAGYYKARR